MAKLLVIDDDITLCDFLRNYFARKGFEVEIATSGEEALPLIEKGFYHVVFLDLLMPKMSGIEALRQIKQKNADIKVIVITASESKEMESLAREYGADDYITKPFSLDYLEGVVLRKLSGFVR